MSHKAKIAKIAKELREANVDGCFLSRPESICWLLNLRGGDVVHTPIFHCYASVSKDEEIILFVDPEKLTQEIENYLGLVNIKVMPETRMLSELCQSVGRK